MSIKVDDFKKDAHCVLDDDYMFKGYQCKAKVKTGAGFEHVTNVDIHPGEVSAGKITLKLPKPFGQNAIKVNKLETDKKCNYKVELEVDKSIHKIPYLKLEGKTNHVMDPRLAKVFLTFAGMKGNVAGYPMEAQVQTNLSPMAPQKAEFEVAVTPFSYLHLGVKSPLSNFIGDLPCAVGSLGVRVGGAACFASLMAKQTSTTEQSIEAHGFFKMKLPGLGSMGGFDLLGKDLKIGALCSKRSGKDTDIALGCVTEVMSGYTLKGKVEGTMGSQFKPSFALALKAKLAENVYMHVGTKFTDKPNTYGFQLHIE